MNRERGHTMPQHVRPDGQVPVRAGLATLGLRGAARVMAVIVTYQADARLLQGLLDDLAEQALAAVVVVDNGSPSWPELCCRLPMQVQRLARNRGLAHAQNQGLRLACAAGASHVLLLDQDSRPAHGMVAALLRAAALAQQTGQRVAAFGPCVTDPRGQCEGFVRFASGRYRAVPAVAEECVVPCDMLIASGSLIDVDALNQVGEMRDDLFIDKVDTDWSLRAAAGGYALWGVPDAVLHHRLGERLVRLWFGRWRELPQHQAFRYYYMVRNSLLLQRQPHAHAAWRSADRRQLLSLLLYFGILAPGRGRALLMMLRGAWDGLRQRAGPLHPGPQRGG